MSIPLDNADTLIAMALDPSKQNLLLAITTGGTLRHSKTKASQLKGKPE